jgi:hypothetical protein
MGVPSWDSGFASDPPSKITYEIDAPDTWLLGVIPIVTGQKIDKVKSSVEGDGIIEDTLKIRDEVTKLVCGLMRGGFRYDDLALLQCSIPRRTIREVKEQC